MQYVLRSMFQNIKEFFKKLLSSLELSGIGIRQRLAFAIHYDSYTQNPLLHINRSRRPTLFTSVVYSNSFPTTTSHGRINRFSRCRHRFPCVFTAVVIWQSLYIRIQTFRSQTFFRVFSQPIVSSIYVRFYRNSPIIRFVVFVANTSLSRILARSTYPMNTVTRWSYSRPLF